MPFSISKEILCLSCLWKIIWNFLYIDYCVAFDHCDDCGLSQKQDENGKEKKKILFTSECDDDKMILLCVLCVVCLFLTSHLYKRTKLNNIKIHLFYARILEMKSSIYLFTENGEKKVKSTFRFVSFLLQNPWVRSWILISYLLEKKDDEKKNFILILRKKEQKMVKSCF